MCHAARKQWREGDKRADWMDAVFADSRRGVEWRCSDPGLRWRIRPADHAEGMPAGAIKSQTGVRGADTTIRASAGALLVACRWQLQHFFRRATSRSVRKFFAGVLVHSLTHTRLETLHFCLEATVAIHLRPDCLHRPSLQRPILHKSSKHVRV